MSFKRACNDGQQLSLLKKRRVTELLAEDIPENEALRTKNGRLCCLACHNRPMFDTLDMLYLHRAGKKHQQNADSFYAQQSELKLLKEKRRHEAYIKTGSAKLQEVALRESSGRFSLSAMTGQYNPCMKKKLKPDQRRTVLQLHEDEAVGTEKHPMEATQLTSVPGYIKPYVSNKSPDSFRGSQSECHNHAASRLSASGPSGYAASKLGQGGSQHDSNQFLGRDPAIGRAPKLGQIGPKQQIPKTIPEYRKAAKHKSNEQIVINPYSKRHPDNQKDEVSLQPETEHGVCLKTEAISRSKVNVSQTVPRHRVKNKMKVDILSPDINIDAEKKRKAELYLQARGSGWKLDWSGQNWIRDEDAEFDSDEEPPQL